MNEHEERTTTVLIVDDERAVRLILEQALTQAGLKVLTADRGDVAVELYRQVGDTVDVVLLDVRMTPWDGPHTLTELRELNPDVRAVFMTGAPGQYTVADLLGYGAAKVVEKPFRSLSALAQEIRGMAETTSPR